MQNDPTYKNWFVWGKGKGVNGTEPPSNWQRIGGPPGSGWNREVEGQVVPRDEWFFSQFSSHMPDFNLREPQVIQYWKKFLKLWLDFGLDGFRIDAISHGFEFVNEDGTFPDEERNLLDDKPDSFGYLLHTYTVDQPELFELTGGKFLIITQGVRSE